MMNRARKAQQARRRAARDAIRNDPALNRAARRGGEAARFAKRAANARSSRSSLT